MGMLDEPEPMFTPKERFRVKDNFGELMAIHPWTHNEEPTYGDGIKLFSENI